MQIPIKTNTEKQKNKFIPVYLLIDMIQHDLQLLKNEYQKNSMIDDLINKQNDLNQVVELLTNHIIELENLNLSHKTTNNDD